MHTALLLGELRSRRTHTHTEKLLICVFYLWVCEDVRTAHHVFLKECSGFCLFSARQPHHQISPSFSLRCLMTSPMVPSILDCRTPWWCHFRRAFTWSDIIFLLHNYPPHSFACMQEKRQLFSVSGHPEAPWNSSLWKYQVCPCKGNVLI